MPVLNSQSTDEERIKEIIDNQTQCWNDGDINCFMKSYWKSEDLKFIGANGITYGWNNTLKNYKLRYPDKTAMGALKFDILEMNSLAPNVYTVVGKFHLTRTIGDLEGYFTLIWKKIDGEWLIIADHTSG